MRLGLRNADPPIAKGWLASVFRAFCLFGSVLLLGVGYLHAQCPDTGQTKVIKPNQGGGYDFYRFMGDSSFRYFIDGKKFSFNEKDDPGRTIIFVDDFAYESILVESADVAEYFKSPKDIDILRAQAKHMQDHFKSMIPSMIIMDYGPAYTKNPDGSDARLFYLWKKENPPGKEVAPQYLCSTLVKHGVVVCQSCR